MENKYGINLELLTNNFKQKIQEVSNISKNAGNNIKKSLQIKDTDSIVKIEQLKQEIRTLQSEIKYVKPDTLAFNEYAKAIDEAKKELNELNKTQKTFSIKTSKEFDKSISKVKKFGLSLLSVRSIYSVLSKASSAYLNQDIELANKMQSVWVGLGSMLAPLIEKIANILIKGVSYINIFIKALTGVDLLQKAIAKSTKKSNKELKSMNKTLASFDELVNIKQASSSGSVDTSWIKSFEEVKLDLDWVEKIKSFGKWVKENWEDVVSTLLLVKVVIDLLTGNWFGVIVDIVGYIVVNVPRLVQAVKLLGESFAEIWNKWISPSLTKIADKISSTFNDVKNAIKTKVSEWGNAIKETFNWTKIKSPFIEIKDKIINAFKVNGSIGKYFTTSYWKEKISNIKFPKIKLSVSYDTDVGKAKTAVYKALGLEGWPKFSISSYDVGTNYVPNDQLAMIHKGEAIVPKKFNSEEYFNRFGNNEQTNYLLTQLIQVVNDKDFNAEISYKEVGKASTRYINETSRIMGESVINV